MHAEVQYVEAMSGQIVNYPKDLVGIRSLTYCPGTTGTAPTPDESIVMADLTRTTQVLVQVALTLLS